MRYSFDRELDALNENLLKMGAVIEQAISLAIDGLVSMRDNTHEIKRLETEADEMEHLIEGQCMHIILTQQPVAMDLRITATAMKMTTDMERIADQALDISEIARHLLTMKTVQVPAEISLMAQKAVAMVHESIVAFVSKDLELAQAVILADDTVDAFFLKIREEIIANIRNETARADVAIDFVMIAKYIERIADHAVNLAEWVVFLLTGIHKDVKIV